MIGNKNVTSNAIRLIKPGQFELTQIEHTMNKNDVEVEPYLASVCHADLRYFSGNRRKEALANKLPMALFHEGLGIVKNSLHQDFKQGDRVIIIPSIPGYALKNTNKENCCDNCRKGGSPNYCLNGVFLGSGYDGISQSKLVINGNNLVSIPPEIEDNIAILTELCSVSLFAINNIGQRLNSKNGEVAVFGDGPVGYLTAAALHFIYNIPKDKLLVFGAVPEKIDKFKAFARTELVQDYDFLNKSGVETIFECTGGKFSASAINQAINLIDRQGTIVLMGVTEELVPINTRDVLEKGIHLMGSSRSTVYEFEQLIKAYKKEDYRNALKELIPENIDIVRSPEDLRKVMNNEVENKGWKKTYISFDWENL